MNENDIIKAWEKRVGIETAHIEAKKILKLPALYSLFNSGLKWIKTDNKTILDYGCGGGLLGEYLFQNEYRIKKYIGMDIADRSLMAARNRLDKIKSFDKLFVKVGPKGIGNLDSLKVDILICFNVIQHFPDKDYFDYFFKKMEKSGIPEILLNVRYGEVTKFQDYPYKTTHEINLANWTNSGDVSGLLPSYHLSKQSKKKNQKLETMYFKLKDKSRKND